MMVMQDRLSALVQHYTNGNVRRFTVETNIPYASIADGIKGKLKYPNGKTLFKIVTRYPEVSSNWLLTGQGNMLLKENEVSGSTHFVFAKSSGEYQHSKDFANLTRSRETRKLISVPPHSVRSFFLTCDEHSLTGMVEAGNTIELIESDVDLSSLRYGSPYLVETATGQSKLRLIFPGKDSDTVILKGTELSHTPETELHKDYIISLCRVIRKQVSIR